MPRLYESTSDPTVSDDGLLAYRAGDQWRNTADNGLFQLIDAAPGAAIWKPLGTNVMVAGGAALTLTSAHAGKTIALDTAAGTIITLPTSSGSGNVFRFLVTVTATSNSHIIKVGNATDEMRGFVVQDSDTATAPNIWWAADNDDTITLNRTTTGLAAQGEYFEIVDATSGHFFVRGYSQASGTEATPFSATVS